MVMEWLIPALISAGTSAYAVNESSKGQEDANMQNLAIAENQMKFQEKAFRNRHQWEVEDLRAAGLNPILSATGGQAPVPSGASAVMINPKRDSSDIIANSAKSVIDIVNGVMSAKTSQKQQGNIDKEGKILENKIGQSASEKITAENQAVKSKYDALYTSELAREQKYKSDIAGITSAKTANEYKYETPGTAWMRHVGHSAKPWLDFGGDVLNMFNRGKFKIQNNGSGGRNYPIPYTDYGRR